MENKTYRDILNQIQLDADDLILDSTLYDMAIDKAKDKQVSRVEKYRPRYLSPRFYSSRLEAMRKYLSNKELKDLARDLAFSDRKKEYLKDPFNILKNRPDNEDLDKLLDKKSKELLEETYTYKDRVKAIRNRAEEKLRKGPLYTEELKTKEKFDRMLDPKTYDYQKGIRNPISLKKLLQNQNPAEDTREAGRYTSKVKKLPIPDNLKNKLYPLRQNVKDYMNEFENVKRFKDSPLGLRLASIGDFVDEKTDNFKYNTFPMFKYNYLDPVLHYGGKTAKMLGALAAAPAVAVPATIYGAKEYLEGSPLNPEEDAEIRAMNFRFNEANRGPLAMR